MTGFLLGPEKEKPGANAPVLRCGLWRVPQARWDQANCWSMNAVNWDLLMAPTLVAAS